MGQHQMLGRMVSAAKRGQISLLDEELGDDNAGAAAKRRRLTEKQLKKKKEQEEEPEYEKTARSFPAVRHLLPIKTNSGLVERKLLVRQEKTPAVDEVDQADATAAEEEEKEEEEENGDLAAEEQVKSVADVFADRRRRIDEAKLRIGLLSRAVTEDPHGKYDPSLRRLQALLCETEPSVLVTVRKYAAASFLEVFSHLLPGHRLHPHDLTGKQLKKDTLALYKYENALVSAYKQYLVTLEQYSRLVSSNQPPLQGLAVFCVDLLCQCLVKFPDFNFSNSLVDALVPLANSAADNVRTAVHQSLRTVFAEDKRGELTLQIVRRLHALIKSKQWECRRELTDLFLALPIRVTAADIQQENEQQQKKLTHKQKLLMMSRKERKRSKKLEALERELMATRAQEDQTQKRRHHTDILTAVLTVYFNILSRMPRSALIESVLEGLAKFAHMINVDFFHDLVSRLERLLTDSDENGISTRHQLLCVRTVFVLLTGQGELINVDPLPFYRHAYRILNTISLTDDSGAEQELEVALACLHLMLITRRRKVSAQRVLGFAKRLAALSVRAAHPAAMAALYMLRSVCMAHSVTGRLLDTETEAAAAGGLYRADVDDPEYCGAGNSRLYELTTVRRGYHAPVRALAAHLLQQCPAQGECTLAAPLRGLSAEDVLRLYSTREMRFTPAVTPPSVLKKRRRRRAAAAAPAEWLAERLRREPRTSAVEDDGVDWAGLLATPAAAGARS